MSLIIGVPNEQSIPRKQETKAPAKETKTPAKTTKSTTEKK